MKDLKKVIVIIFLFLAFIGIVGLLYFNSTFKEEKINESTPGENKQVSSGKVYHLDNIRVWKGKKKIEFPAVVKKNKEKVKFLIYLEGYKWLRSESAVISESYLSNLQKAIALIDWKLWNSIWYEKKMPEEKKLKLYLKWKQEGRNKKIEARKLLLTEEEYNFRDYIFMGSPFLDEAVLEEGYDSSSCKKCPFFSIEKRFIRGKEYELRSKLMPPIGKEVKVIIKIKKGKE